MIDIHSHILVGIDDGAQQIEDAIALINQSVESGITKIIATPHIHFGTFDNNLQSIEHAFKQLSVEVEKSAIEVELAFAAEVRICPEIMLLAKSNKLPFLGKFNAENVLLLEFPHSHIPPGSEKLTAWLLANNIRPLIAHPERNRDLWQHPYLINEFVKQGCLLQLTAASLLGDFGKQSQLLAWQYLESEIVHLIASDMHNIKRRPSRMAEAYKLIVTKFGSERADRLFVTNPTSIFASNSSVQSFIGMQ